MVFIDIETTGIDREKCGILSIGAIALDGMNTFYQECNPGNVLVTEDAMAINGQKIRDIKNRKVSSCQAVTFFVSWALQRENPILAGYNLASFDVMFLHKAWNGTFNMDWPLGRRFVDIHSIAYGAWDKSFSSDGLSRRLGIEPEKKPHNALSGAIQARNLYLKMLKTLYWNKS